MTLAQGVSVVAADIARTIRMILDEDGLSGSFHLRPYSYQGRAIRFETSDSLLFEFPTLKSSFPNLYNSSTYKLLLVLSEHDRKSFPTKVLNDINRLLHKDNIDKIVLWLSHQLEDDIFEHLKRQGIDIIHHRLPSEIDLKTSPLRHFVPVTGATMDHSLCVNHIGNSLVTRLRKLFHFVLSEIAAPVYDDEYATHMVATKAIMDFEERIVVGLANTLAQEGRDSIAVDVGCGTGRHSFLVAQTFREVYSFDLSPRMIQRAEEKKKAQEDNRIVFWTNDFEYERITDEQRFSGRTDLAVASFGMGSFIEDTVGMLRRFSQWLRPGGRVLLSFYNENSGVLRLKPTWRDTSLASNINLTTKSLRVNLPGGVSFDIFCKPFNEGTKGEINKIFDIERLCTFPTLLALLPNNLLQDEVASRLFGKVDEILSKSATPLIPARLREDEELRKLTAVLDERLAKDGEVGYGHYVIVVARKTEPTSIGYGNALAVLEKEARDECEIITHGPVLSLGDVRRELGAEIPLDTMLKTLIFKERSARFIAVSVPGDARIDKNRLAELLGIGRRSLRFASEKDINQLGFPLGGIGPLGFRPGDPVRRLIDAAVEQTMHEWLYTGVGDNRRTLKIRRSVFLNLVRDCERINIPRSGAQPPMSRSPAPLGAS